MKSNSRLERVVRARGAGFLDAPISGTSLMVARGEGVITVAGDRAQFARCGALLESIARPVHYVGPCGQGSVLKLVTNLIMGLNVVALAEGLTLARCAGLDLAQTLEVLSQGAARSRMLEVRGPSMVEGRFDPMMTVENFLKDLALIVDEGRAHRAPLPLTGLVEQLFLAAATLGLGGDDVAAVARLYHRLAGLDHQGAR